MHITRARRAAALAAILWAAALAPARAVPPGFNIQGRLTDANGVNREGNYSIKFTIYDAATGGTAIWTRTYTALTVRNGNFQTVIGDVAGQPPLSDVFAGDSRYLDIQVLGGPGISSPEPSLVPRQQLMSVPYAFQAGASKAPPTNVGSGSDGPRTISGNVTLAAGEYHFTDFTVSPGAVLSVEGHAIIRCTGIVSIQGTVNVQAGALGGNITLGGAFGLDAGGHGFGIGGGGGGNNSNRGGNGGGNGGRGGNASGAGFGSVSYPWRIQPYGSGGGAGQMTTTGSAGAGGGGGGGFIVVAKGPISISGSVTADGGTGGVASNGGGGGSGGTIAIFSETSINAGGSIRARGGTGGSGNGGGGGGGWVVLVSPATTASSPNVSGGSGSGAGSPGESGRALVLNEPPGFKAL